MSKLFVYFVAFFVLQMCSNNPNAPEMANDSYSKGVTEEMQNESSKTLDTEAQQSFERETAQKIIKDGELFLETKNAQKTKAHLDSLVKKYKGYLSAEEFQDNDYQFSIYYTVRIPSANFESFLSNAEKGEGKVTHKQINARDVTTQFIDLETRLANKEKYIERYRQLLKKANSIKEILEIERQIRTLEEELESAKGQLQYLSNQVQYSTLRITITQKKDYQYTPQQRDSFWQKLKASVSKGWFVFVDFLLLLLTLWPFWIAIAVVIFLIRRYNKRKKNRKFPTH